MGPRYRRVWLDRPGTIDDLRIVEDRLSPLGAYEVRIAVRALDDLDPGRRKLYRAVYL